MDCNEAQSVISDALDGVTQDAATLEEAKQHCRDCHDCTEFVRALNLVKRAPLPEPSADLVERVMAGVRAEAAFQKARAAQTEAETTPEAAASAAAAELITTEGGPTADDLEALLASTATVRPARRSPSIAVWLGAAAVLLVGVGVLGVLGVRMMSQGQGDDVTTRVVSAPTESGGAAFDSRAGSRRGRKRSCRRDEERCRDRSGPQLRGLRRGRLPAHRPIHAREGPAHAGRYHPDPARRQHIARPRRVRGRGVDGVYLDDDQGQLLEFQPLQRVFAGRTYQLQSAAITRFGVWPSLPAGISAPTSSDGSPTFVAAGSDGTGVTVYRKTSSTAAEGIALPPNPPSPDPATGQPSWTWWAPVK